LKFALPSVVNTDCSTIKSTTQVRPSWV
jgi:hypothetical protein